MEGVAKAGATCYQKGQRLKSISPSPEERSMGVEGGKSFSSWGENGGYGCSG